MMEGFQKTEIGYFPDNWKIGRIEDYFEIQQGKSVSKANRIGNNQKPFLRTSNLLWGKVILDELDFLHFSDEEEIRYQLHYNDLLVCEGGDIGRTAIWKSELVGCYYQNHLHRLRSTNSNIIPEFVLFWMQYAFLYAKLYYGRANITTIPNLSKSRLSEFEIPVPPLSEQRKIAYLLSTVQKAIEQQDKLIRTTTELKKALMQKLFTEGIYGEKQKQTEIGLVPESWDVVELGEVCEKPQYGFTDSASKEGNVKFLRITDITEFGVIWEDVPFCNCPDYKKYELKNGDIVFARIGATTGKSYLINNPPKSIYASYLIRVRCENKILPNFLIYYFETERYWRQIDSTKGNNLKGGVNSSILSKLLTPKPTLIEQKKITEILYPFDKKMQFCLKKKQILTSLFKTLLHELMTGQRRINDIEFGEGSSSDLFFCNSDGFLGTDFCNNDRFLDTDFCRHKK
ncbi:MAG: restriction endonuclease subunit S [Prevotellaceae bacterium]|jgi:type I restriction enzyme S subunit|nr:restriction endonuclease subunit S [Prevotellaceae bacterium]